MFDCCGPITHVVQAGHFPLRYDAGMNELHLVRSGGCEDEFCVLRYCPFCGNRFPESARPGLKNFWTNLEAQKLAQLVRTIRNAKVMRATLGEPDEVVTPACSPCSILDPWIRAYEYWRQFETCQLTFHEFADGSLRLAISAKAPDTAEVTRPPANKRKRAPRKPSKVRRSLELKRAGPIRRRTGGGAGG